MYTPGMAGLATTIMLTEHERSILDGWVRKPATQQHMAQRARILAQLDAPPPDGYTTWTGRLVA